MELVLIEKASKKEIILYSNKAEKGIDFVTSIYDSKKDLLESVNLDPEKFDVIKRYKDENGKTDEEILTNQYNGIFNILEDKEKQKKFEEDIFNSDLGISYRHISSVCYTRSKYNFNNYLKKSKKMAANLFEEIYCLEELRSRKNYPESIIKDQEEKYKNAIHNYLYDKDGKLFYNNFLGFYKVLCDENVLEKNIEPVDPDIKEGISSLFRKKLLNYINNGVIEKESNESLVKLESIKNKIDDLRRLSYDDEPLHGAITESYDIDEFETNLDILMDEQGLSDEAKEVARVEMRKRFEKKNKTL